MYQNGLGVDKSPRTAYEWYLKAAKNECPKSQCELGHLYLNNQFTPRYHNNLSTNKTLNEENLVNPDIKKSIHWLLKAGKQWEYNAVDKLIELFEQKLKGDDLTIFLDCLKKFNGLLLGEIYLKGIQVEQDYQKAYGFFRACYPMGQIRHYLDDGETDAGFYLGFMYMHGLGVKNKEKAEELFKFSSCMVVINQKKYLEELIIKLVKSKNKR